MHTDFMKELNDRMNQIFVLFKKYINKNYAIRISPDLLEGIKINYYGSQIPLKQLSNITVENSNTLKINVFDNKILRDIEKEIFRSKLELTPLVSDNIIRIVFPALTEDRRKKIFKLICEESETCRINIRNIRRDANHKLKKFSQDKYIGNDTEYDMQHQVQKMTDNYMKKINSLLLKTKKEIMKI
ncbi:ribosome recycling factor [Buchnera aphidicola]|uniref:ribosome recycling factor n=1 Tax=Buchnera aphidicola TaxID=9 RepID=UPI0031B86A79